MSTESLTHLHEFLSRLRNEIEGLSETTNNATDVILDQCDHIGALNNDNTNPDPDVAISLEVIYQASAVQDLTNQRLQKISRMLDVFEQSGELASFDTLLEGPQRQADALSQDDIDQLMGSDADSKG